LGLAELFLGCGNQAEVMLGMLEVVFGGDRVTGTLRIARQLYVFFGDQRRVTADFDVGAIRFEDTRQGILAFAVMIIVVVVIVIIIVVVAATTPHAFALIVSHDLPCLTTPYAARPIWPQVPHVQPNSRFHVSTSAHSNRWLAEESVIGIAVFRL